MDFLLNKSSHPIFVEGLLLVPGKPVPVKNHKDLASRLPHFAQMLESGEVALVDKPKTKAKVKGEPRVDEPAKAKDETRTDDSPGEGEPQKEIERGTTFRRKRG